MKNTSLKLIAFSTLLISVISCNSGSQTNSTSRDSTATQATTERSMPAPKSASSSVTASGAVCAIDMAKNYNTMNDYDSAKKTISYYIGNNMKNTSAYSFVFNVDADFKFYSGNSAIAYMHFILAQDGYGQLMLYVSGIDSTGNHIYIHDTTGTNKYYVFKNTMSSGFGLPRMAPLPGGLTVPQAVSFTKNTLSVNDDATAWISEYKNNPSPTKNTTAYSFILASSAFKDYLATSVNMTRLRFYIAENSGKLALIIVGEDGGGKEIYVLNGGVYSALEFCNPCPQCVEIPGRAPLQFETPCQTKKDYHLHYRTDLKDKFQEAYK